MNKIRYTCRKCFWSEGGMCFNKKIAKIKKINHALSGEEINDDLIARCKKLKLLKKDIQSSQRAISVLKESIRSVQSEIDALNTYRKES